MINDNVLYTFVGSTYSTTLPNADGEVAIEFEDGTFGDGTGGATGGANFRIVKFNSKGILEHSPWISPGSGLSLSQNGYVAEVLDKWTLTCDAGVEKDELKSVWLVVQDSLTTFGNKSMMKNAVYSTLTATASAATIAAGLKASFDRNMIREPYKFATASVSTADFIITALPKALANGYVPKPGLWGPDPYTFKLLPADVGTVVHTTKGQAATNSISQIKDEEWFAMGNRGYGYRVDSIPVDSQLSSDAVYTALGAGGNQECVYFKFKDQNFINIVGQSPASVIETKTFLTAAEATKFVLDLNASIAGA